MLLFWTHSWIVESGMDITWGQNIQETFRNLETLYISFSHQKHAKDKRMLWISQSDTLGVSGIEIARKTHGKWKGGQYCVLGTMVVFTHLTLIDFYKVLQSRWY